jgi:hypothetical protein
MNLHVSLVPLLEARNTNDLNVSRLCRLVRRPNLCRVGLRSGRPTKLQHRMLAKVVGLLRT